MIFSIGWFMTVVIVLILLCLLGIAWFWNGGNNANNNVIIQNRVLDNNNNNNNLGAINLIQANNNNKLRCGSKQRSNSSSISSSNLNDSFDSADNLYSDQNDFRESLYDDQSFALGGDGAGNFSKPTITKSASSTSSFLLHKPSSSSPSPSLSSTLPIGPQGPEGKQGRAGSGGRLDLGIISYYGIIRGFSDNNNAAFEENTTAKPEDLLLSKKTILGFGPGSASVYSGGNTTSRHLFLLSPQAVNDQPRALEHQDQEEQRVLHNLSGLSDEDDAVVLYRARQREKSYQLETQQYMIGSFWVNPTSETIHLRSLRVTIMANSLSVVPQTVVQMQVHLAAPGSPQFVPVGEPQIIELHSTEVLSCFGSPQVEFNIPVSPGTTVSLSASVSFHFRGSLHIGGGLSYL